MWYLSPLRDEKTPSFKVDQVKNRFYDWGGNNDGGDIIDLVCALYNESFKAALERLKGDFSSSIDNSYKKTVIDTSKAKPRNTLQLIEARPLENSALIYYISSTRKINIEIAKKYLCEVWFNIVENGLPTQKKNQYAIGFKNDHGFYEFRNQYLKGYIGDSGENKTITTLNLKSGGDIAVFEGFMDFMSFLTENKLSDFKSSVLVLNSNSNWKHVEKTLSGYSFNRAFYFMDNDESGISTKEKLESVISATTHIDKSTIYKNFKDYNQYLTQKS